MNKDCKLKQSDLAERSDAQSVMFSLLLRAKNSFSENQVLVSHFAALENLFPTSFDRRRLRDESGFVLSVSLSNFSEITYIV